jgi:hypothetical protein
MTDRFHPCDRARLSTWRAWPLGFYATSWVHHVIVIEDMCEGLRVCAGIVVGMSACNLQCIRLPLSRPPVGTITKARFSVISWPDKRQLQGLTYGLV